jgi:hypothetical protein
MNPNHFASQFSISTEFVAPDSADNIKVDNEKTFEVFRKGFISQGKYHEANKIYFEYRFEKLCEEGKIILNDVESYSLKFSEIYLFIFDLACLITSGFGVDIRWTLISSAFIILVFTPFYKYGPIIEYSTNYELFFKLKKRGNLLYKPNEQNENNPDATFWDILHFSVKKFLNTDSGEWSSKSSFIVTIEVASGLVMLGIFTATLANMMINLST